MQASEDLLRSAQIQAPLLQRALTLGRVTGDTHLLIVDTFNQGVNSTTPAGVLANNVLSGAPQRTSWALDADRVRSSDLLGGRCARAKSYLCNPTRN
jgi:hypothetical protein